MKELAAIVPESYADRVTGAQGRSGFAGEWPDGSGWRGCAEDCFVRLVGSSWESIMVHKEDASYAEATCKRWDSAMDRVARWKAIGSLLRLEVSLAKRGIDEERRQNVAA